ncbi:MAG TPA: 5'-deoxyadenosine deaminase [Syntrophomonadaceae bacterium]|nr:5'-deoxyadenosine deaminase [Syntrophomonadaceae bacterium]
MSILIKNGIIVTMNPRRDVFSGDLLIEDDRIVQIGKTVDANADLTLNASGKLVIPGLIQTHVHLCQALFRGMADDLELLDWLSKRIWPLEAAHDEDSLYYSSLLACAELLRGGTTSVIDMATVHHSTSVFEAVKLAGIRYLGGKCLMDLGDQVPKGLIETSDLAIQESLDLMNTWQGCEQGRIRYAFCPRFAVSCSHRLLKDIQILSTKHKIPVHTHASESLGEIALIEKDRGMPNILYLDSLGLCNENLILAHCVHINREELKTLAKSQTRIAHCPSGNLKLASGIAPVPQLMEAGARVSLGADGAPCNNNLNMFMEMRLAALIHKPHNGPTAMPADQVFAMATLEGAKAIGQENEIGSLEVGKKADVVVVSLDAWHSRPLNAASVYSHLVYQAQASDVHTTIVDGRIVLQDGRLLSISEHEVKEKSEHALLRVCKRAGIQPAFSPPV